MSRRFDCGAVRIDTGWLGYYQMPNGPARLYVRNGLDRVVFASKQEGRNVAWHQFIRALNRSLIGGKITVAVPPTAAREAANKIFRGGGKTVDVEVTGKERREARV